MNSTEIRRALSNPDTVRKMGFEIVKSLCTLRNSSTDQQGTQELILRALEQRSRLGAAVLVLDALVRDVGLFPYLQASELGIADLLAFEAHRAPGLDQFVFHHPQAKVFHTLMSGKSVVLRAPTSFGKSLIIDAIVASKRFRNIVIVVPSLALIDETRRRLSQFRTKYVIVTQAFQKVGERNIFIMTQERILDSKQIECVDFFVIDEFYKLSPINQRDDRSALLNQVFYQLSKRCRHFYLLGPGIQGLSAEFRNSLHFEFFHEPYNTVVSELHRINPGQKPLEKLAELAATLNDPTLVFCSSPDRAKKVAAALPNADIDSDMKEAAVWIAENYHPEWHIVDGMQRGIGIHHGRVPRALAQYIVRAFDREQLRFLVCTSTLIEGVNTKAKNIVVYDHKINNQPLDLFTFNNIRGRSGRMFKHFVGHVYLFHEQPQEGLPLIDVPAFTQGISASDALLVQIEPQDLTGEAESRIERYHSHPRLPFSVIRENVGVSPEAQIALADELLSNPHLYSQKLSWQGVPNFEELLPVCELIWSFFDGGSLGGRSAKSPRQLATVLLQLSRKLSIRELIILQLPFCKNDPDLAVRSVLDFQRLWAMFHFPRLLRAIGRVQYAVFAPLALRVGNYDVFASLVENLFLSPALLVLEEYGVPLPLGRKLETWVDFHRDLHEALEAVRVLPLANLPLSHFERSIIEEARETI